MPPYLTLEMGVVALIIVRAMSLLALWLRLHWRARHEETRRRTVVAVAQSLPWGLQVEEQRADGTRLKVSWVAGQLTESSNGEH